MKNRYEGLLVLNFKGTEDGAKEVIERLEGDFKKEGAKIEQVQKMDRRQFSYAAGDLDGGYYVNFIFNAEPQVIAKLRSKFKLDETVYRQNYLKLSSKIVEKPVRTPRPVKAA
ncbi:MAG: 30S ribosomal protein S6 [Chthoniobacter sp.]|nr:30S ribosomal protein S6 [Chthoniobacter sp.]